MKVRPNDFAAWRVGWGQKSTSIVEIAEELNLGTSAFVLIDDSPLERAAVSMTLPEVDTIEMPADPALWYESVSASGQLDRLPPTIDDLARAESYRQERVRQEGRGNASLEDFLMSLQLEVAIARVGQPDVLRAAQLVAKTNQFTLAGRRWSESELTACLDDTRYDLRLVSAVDRFGDYGAIGVFIVDKHPHGSGVPLDVALLETFALSCRAMGRGIESAMVAAAFESAGTALGVRVHAGPKNEPARRFFADLGCTEPDQMTVLKDVVWPSHIRRTGSSQPAVA
jgi:FkbH-like protein